MGLHQTKKFLHREGNFLTKWKSCLPNGKKIVNDSFYKGLILKILKKKPSQLRTKKKTTIRTIAIES